MVRTEPETAALHPAVVKLSDSNVGVFPDLTTHLKDEEETAPGTPTCRSKHP